MGTALTKLGKLDEAIAEYREAIRLQPELAAAHVNLGAILCDQLGKPDEAEIEFREAIRLQPELAEAYENLGIALLNQGKLDEALQEVRQAESLSGGELGALNKFAWELATTSNPKLRHHERALEVALEAVELHPQHSGTWSTLGVARYRNGQWSEAITALEKSVEISSGGTPADWLFLAMAHWQLNQKEEARKWYDKAVAWINSKASADAELLRFRPKPKSCSASRPVNHPLARNPRRRSPRHRPPR